MVSFDAILKHWKRTARVVGAVSCSIGVLVGKNYAMLINLSSRKVINRDINHLFNKLSVSSDSVYTGSADSVYNHLSNELKSIRSHEHDNKLSSFSYCAPDSTD